MNTVAAPMAISIRPPQTSLLLASAGVIDSSVSNGDEGAAPYRRCHARESGHPLVPEADVRQRCFSVATGCLVDAPPARDMTVFVLPGRTSLRLDAALLHHAFPLLHFLLDEGCELGRAHLHDLRPLGGE